MKLDKFIQSILLTLIAVLPIYACTNSNNRCIANSDESSKDSSEVRYEENDEDSSEDYILDNTIHFMEKMPDSLKELYSTTKLENVENNWIYEQSHELIQLYSGMKKSRKIIIFP